MEKYKVMTDFGGIGIIPLLKSIVTAVPLFFPLLIFFIWIFGTASSYYAIYTFSGRRRFWHSLTAMSFACFIISLVVSGMNESDFTYLGGYWTAFYIVMTAASWYLLEHYK
jgi:hypothetical protein